MLLSDKDIQESITQGRISIAPFDSVNLRSGSYSLSLGSIIYKLKKVSVIDIRESKQQYEEILLGDEGYLLQPGEFIVCKSKEHVRLADDIAGILSTRGSRAQAGLSVLLGSLFIEPGTDNPIALELHNESGFPMKIFLGVPVVKIIFLPLSSMADQTGRGNDFFKRQELA